MDRLKTFKKLADEYGDQTEVYVELEDGRIVEVFGFEPKNNSLIIKLSPRPYDFRKHIMEE